MPTERFQCKNCGQEYLSVNSMIVHKCTRGNNRGKHHEFYEGSMKDKYMCKHCGYKAQTIMSMSYLKCANGGNKGRYHEPAL